jgi:hypothetical protein
MEGEGHLKAAKERFPEHFKLSEEVISRLHEWIDRPDIPIPQTFLGIVKFASVVRAFNLYRSINLLLENDHWEDAAILARSMFELLLNLEEIVRDEQSAEEKAQKYLRYQHLSKLLHYVSDKRYEINTGRAPKEEETKIAEMEKSTSVIFGEFIDKRKNKGWSSSWCGKSVRKLAKDSGKQIRLVQYELLYSYFSEFSHSNPLATMTTMDLGRTSEETERLLQNKEEIEKASMARVLILSTTWLLEILFVGKSEIPLYDIKWNFDILKRIYRFYGVEPPKLPDF